MHALAAQGLNMLYYISAAAWLRHIQHTEWHRYCPTEHRLGSARWQSHMQPRILCSPPVPSADKVNSQQTVVVMGSVGVSVFGAGRAAMVLQVGLHKLEGVLARDHFHTANAIGVRHAVDLICFLDDLRSTTTAGHPLAPATSTDMTSSKPCPLWKASEKEHQPFSMKVSACNG